MLDWKSLYKITGTLLWLEAALMFVCFGMSVYYLEDDMLAFILAVIITAAGGCACRYLGRDADDQLGRKDAYMLVTATWIIFSLFGMLPFLIGGYIHSFTDAFFETISGFTTTGASIIDDVECLPHGILFWRTMTQWIGGLGIVFFTIALLPSLAGSGGNIKVFSAEATGPLRTKLHPRLSTNSHAIWMIYIVLTIACGAMYYVGGMDIFDAMNYSMTTTATGGFATHNSSTVFFNSPFIEYTATLFMFLSGINFTLLYMGVIKRKVKDFVCDTELRLYVSIIVLATAIIIYCLMAYNHYDIWRALRFGLFQVVSFTTSTGLFSDDVGIWNHVTWIILGILMFLGGCAGSTAGGIKTMRIVMVLKIIRNEFQQMLHPNAVLPVRVNNVIIPNTTRNKLLSFIMLYMMLFLVAATYFTAIGIDVTNSIMLCLSCLSNVGPTLDIGIGPAMSWAALPVACKWFCAALMLVGRLEILSVLILFTKEFWHSN